MAALHSHETTERVGRGHRAASEAGDHDAGARGVKRPISRFNEDRQDHPPKGQMDCVVGVAGAMVVMLMFRMLQRYPVAEPLLRWLL